MTTASRPIALFVKEPYPGRFVWVLMESEWQSWKQIDSASEACESWTAAWEAGCVEMGKLASDKRQGPRQPAQADEPAPVGWM